MTYKIEKNVPMPIRIGRTECLYPFADMSLGDSFSIDVGDRTVNSVRKMVSGWLPRFRQAMNCPRFAICSKVSDDGKTVRVWRIPDQAPMVRAKPGLYDVKRKAG